MVLHQDFTVILGLTSYVLAHCPNQYFPLFIYRPLQNPINVDFLYLDSLTNLAIKLWGRGTLRSSKKEQLSNNSLAVCKYFHIHYLIWSIPSLFPWMAATFPAHKANLGVTATPASFSPHTQFTAEPAGSAPQRPWNPPTSLHLQRHYPHSNCFRLLVSTRAFLLRLMKPNFSKCNAPSPARPCPWETDYSLQAGTWLGPFSVSPASSNTIFSRVPHLTHQTIWSKGQSCAHHYIFSV